MKNPELELALNFVEKTDRNIFLTGKAGTGKTTFLHKIKTESNKRLVVVAPTGVAAINAKGVTIHSFFQMPFGPIIPGQQMQSKGYKQKFNKQKIDLIRSLDLVIIDEISMVRADLLDGIDQVLRRYKNKNKVFGGVQILMIGDLQQLSPVVKPYEWELLQPHYDTAYFFSSRSFLESNVISVELKHIYRQDNKAFIKILNEIRNNKLSKESSEILNKRYLPDFEPKEEGFITLTTHNNRANNMNQIALKKISHKSFFYKAHVKGKFSEHSFPTHENLELKLGAQVMFVKNDSSVDKRYFNGKIGKITNIGKSEIKVLCKGDDEEINVTPELWENISYKIDPISKKISENFQGSFEQIPLKLAWAITIHKSQGLTFEKAIIDAQASFAHGQTYVALSRCKTLEGLVLKTPIESRSIISDIQVETFTNKIEETEPGQKELEESQKNYQLNLIDDLFNFYEFLYPITRLTDIYYKNQNSLKGNIIDPLLIIKDEGLIPLMKVSAGFKSQLVAMSETVLEPQKDEEIQKRFLKAHVYFTKQIQEKIQDPLNDLSFSTENQQVKKDFEKQLSDLEEKLAFKLFILKGLSEGFNADKYLKLRAKAVLQKTKVVTKTKRTYTETTEHSSLFDSLKELRLIICSAEDIPPFQVFTQKTLYEMCEYFPLTSEQLRAIHGMGKIRVSKYGDEILEVIREYVEKNNITPKNKPTKKKKTETVKVVGESQKVSLAMFHSGKSIEEIAKERGLVQGTILGHLSQFIKSGEIRIENLIPKTRLTALLKAEKSIKYDSLSDLKAQIDDTFTYAELRILMNYKAYKDRL